MTIEAINSFANKAAQDAAFRKEIEETTGISIQTLLNIKPKQLKSADKDYPGILTEIASKNGFDFSKEELLEQIRIATSSEELSDEQLEAVAGGKESILPEHVTEPFSKESWNESMDDLENAGKDIGKALSKW